MKFCHLLDFGKFLFSPFLRSWLIDEQKDDGCCALHLAAMQSNEECVEVLLRAGANPNLERMTFFDSTLLNLTFAIYEYNFFVPSSI